MNREHERARCDTLRYETRRSDLESLPLIVHFPSDYYTPESSAEYHSALFSHHDALYWSDPDSQEVHPAFVVTVGGQRDPTWWNTGFSKSEMQQNFAKIIRKLQSDHNVAKARTYPVALAGGSEAMWNTILANADLFAAQINVSDEPYDTWKNAALAETNSARLCNQCPVGTSWTTTTEPDLES